MATTNGEMEQTLTERIDGSVLALRQLPPIDRIREGNGIIGFLEEAIVQVSQIQSDAVTVLFDEGKSIQEIMSAARSDG